MEHFHRHAEQLRVLIGAHDNDPMDPFALACAMGVRVKTVESLDVEDFSGHLSLRDEKRVALLNARQTPERMRVTLLEELCHLHYGHPMSELGEGGREHNQAIEQEAY